MSKKSRKPRNAQYTLMLDAFSVPVSLAHNFACGGVEGEFRVSIKLSTRNLNREGFVVEVGQFREDVKRAFAPDRRFSSNRMFKASCEELAGGVINVAIQELGSRLTRAIVTVQNLTGGVEAIWHDGQVVPEFPRLATPTEVAETLGYDTSREDREPDGMGGYDDNDDDVETRYLDEELDDEPSPRADRAPNAC